MAMKKILLVIASLLFSGIALSATIEGHQIPDQLPAADSQLLLNGAGLREKYMIDLYIGGLYLQAKSSDATAIINADEPMALRLLIVSSRINSENMTETTLEGFQNSLGDKLAAMQPRIDQFMLSFKEPIKEGDVFEMLYLPASGVIISKNGKQLNTVEGVDFKAALFGIWLGEEPAQKSLKEDMLGK
jgi:hypothetical protein